MTCHLHIWNMFSNQKGHFLTARVKITKNHCCFGDYKVMPSCGQILKLFWILLLNKTGACKSVVLVKGGCMTSQCPSVFLDVYSSIHPSIHPSSYPSVTLDVNCAIALFTSNLVHLCPIELGTIFPWKRLATIHSERLRHFFSTQCNS